ncbi:hypothetical protein HYPSUDRAFT_641299 [Hypholoma sublateritium FD-334 SS-4]|uniref:Uncharacterized protein n=1 Tax=Hypholoma sublateritium (strain FD-334 SS-4) TaxID=945553 RepID=A0A0D2MGS4_HYPSF|nr:hypothetical protein HYPSUDRAFT_641299 [Hypholoma sublateritium FD-334 SS-4]
MSRHPTNDTGGQATGFLSLTQIVKNIKSLSGHVTQSFGGLPAPGQQHDEPLRRRRIALSDAETGPAILLQHINEAQLTASSGVEDAVAQPLDLDARRLPSDAQQDLIVILTVNRTCRIITIMALGFWGGWSIMPAEMKFPDSVAWVTYICIVTDWIALASALDCTFPGSMDWYFRRWPEWWFLKRENLPEISITGYNILNILVGLSIAFFGYALQSDQAILNRANVISGSIIFVVLYSLGLVKGNAEGPGAWFFHTNYATHIFYGVESAYNLATWWWIAFRIHGVVKILRNRDKPEMAVQFRILIVGLVVEVALLIWYFAIVLLAYFFKRGWAHWNSALWAERRTAQLAMLVLWALVVIFGLCVELPNIFFPCSGSTSPFCKVLI